MGNHLSNNKYDKDEVIRSLWKSLGAVPVLPINPNLNVLRVLFKQNDGYHDVGTVHSLCKEGNDKKWLQNVVQPRNRLLFSKNKYLLPPRSIGQQTIVISDAKGVLAKAFVGAAHAAAWFKKSESIEVCILGCEVREFNKEKWEEMIQHFDPDLQSSLLGPPDRQGKRAVFIVQKVVLVSQIKITVSYKTNEGLDINTPDILYHGVKLRAGFRSTNSSRVFREFTLSATEKNQKLPVAFSGFRYKYNKFGVRESFGNETHAQPDGEVGESSGASQCGSDDDEADFDDEDIAQNDPHMGSFLQDDEFANIKPINPSEIEIYPYLDEAPEELPDGEEEQDEDIDQNAPGHMEDID